MSSAVVVAVRLRTVPRAGVAAVVDPVVLRRTGAVFAATAALVAADAVLVAVVVRGAGPCELSSPLVSASPSSLPRSSPRRSSPPGTVGPPLPDCSGAVVAVGRTVVGVTGVVTVVVVWSSSSGRWTPI